MSNFHWEDRVFFAHLNKIDWNKSCYRKNSTEKSLSGSASVLRYVLDYVMRQESGGWKVVDVLVDGAISRVAAQRSEMRSMLADSGGAGLLVGLRQKTADLSGGILQ